MNGQMLATLPAADLERARRWYLDTFGIEPVTKVADGALLYAWGGTRFMVYPSVGAGTNEATAAGIVFEDFDEAIADLRAKGVALHEYDFGDDFRTVDGVITLPNGHKTAWITDSEGNILALDTDDQF
jgi:catechol 2,3-dioxygenase-like lactoylglutathione lyase family enzyme